jgi:hypothetical protein
MIEIIIRIYCTTQFRVYLEIPRDDLFVFKGGTLERRRKAPGLKTGGYSVRTSDSVFVLVLPVPV